MGGGLEVGDLNGTHPKGCVTSWPVGRRLAYSTFSFFSFEIPDMTEIERSSSVYRHQEGRAQPCGSKIYIKALNAHEMLLKAECRTLRIRVKMCL